jgi:hypothetical protein
MEFTLKTMVVMILIVVGLLVFSGIVMNIGADIISFFEVAFGPLKEFILGSSP